MGTPKKGTAKTWAIPKSLEGKLDLLLLGPGPFGWSYTCQSEAARNWRSDVLGFKAYIRENPGIPFPEIVLQEFARFMMFPEMKERT